MNRLKQAIELVSNVAIVLVCALLVWLFISHRDVFLHKSPPKQDDGQSLVGTVLPPLPGHQWDPNSRTLVLAIRQGCHFCELSFPFYRHLSELNQAHPGKVRLLGVMPDAREPGELWLKQSKLELDSVFDQTLDSIHVTGTPTLLLLDSHGRVERAWIGQLTDSREREVLTALQL